MTTNTSILSICTSNVQSLNKDKMEHIELEFAGNFDIICLNETNLHNSRIIDFSLDIDGFQPIFRKDRVNRQWGGVAVYVSQNIAATRRSDLENEELEAIWLELRCVNKKFLICNCYRPPNTPVCFWDKLSDSIEQAKEGSINDIIITGDFNSDPTKSPNNYNKLMSLCRNFNLENHISEPTRVTANTESCLDLFITNLNERIQETKISHPVGNSDHCTIELKIILKFSFNKTYKRLIWEYNRADFDKFREQLSIAPWKDGLDALDIDGSCDRWTELFLSIARDNIPHKCVTVRQNDKPFYTSELRNLKRKRDRARKTAQRLKTIYLWDKYRQIRNLYNRSIAEAKEEYDLKLKNYLLKDENLRSKRWWHVAKSYLNKNKSSSYPPIHYNNIKITDNKEKAQAFNDHFQSYSNINDSDASIPEFACNNNPKLSEIKINYDDVNDLIKCIDTSKATGPDLITPRMLKEAGISIVPSLTELFKLSLNINKFPASWKIANVVPIYKKDDPSIINNYRPVSLLSCVGKLLERVVFKYVFNYFHDNKLITPKQSGFMPGDSTVNQLAHLYHLFAEALDQKKDVRVVFCDISKAFDRVWHKGLLFKLERLGITGPLLDWFQNYLSFRKQRVVVNGTFSNWAEINAGVPQGSVLGPLLFLVYINDICDEVDSDIRLFADDTTIFVFVDNPGISADILNNDLKKMNKWAKQWLVQFSPSKTKAMTISLKHNPNHPSLEFDSTVIDEVRNHKHLGLTIQNDLKWNSHIENICTTGHKRLDILSHLKYKLDRRSLEILYLSFIRPILEYACVVWDNCSDELCEKVEYVQRRAARIVSGGIVRTSQNILYKELGWTPLQTRRRELRLTMMHKILKSGSPQYLYHNIPESVSCRTQYSLRNQNNLNVQFARTNLFKSSFVVNTCNEYNELDNNLKGMSANSFKSKIRLKSISPNSWYYLGDRKLSILHSRFRMNCSSLNEDLFNMRIIDCLKCQCGHDSESTLHYFFQCPLYFDIRLLLFDGLDNVGFTININNILFGDDTLSEDNNTVALYKIHDYIKDSKRFK